MYHFLDTSCQWCGHEGQQLAVLQHSEDVPSLCERAACAPNEDCVQGLKPINQKEGGEIYFFFFGLFKGKAMNEVGAGRDIDGSG